MSGRSSIELNLTSSIDNKMIDGSVMNGRMDGSINGTMVILYIYEREREGEKKRK